MAEVVPLAAGILAALDFAATVVSQSQAFMETAKVAPRDLRTILFEVSSLQSALETLRFLSSIDCEFAEAVSNQQSVKMAVNGCQQTLTNLVGQLGSLSISDSAPTGPSKRQKIQPVVSWTWEEGTAEKLLTDVVQYKTTIMLGLLTQTVHEAHETRVAGENIQPILAEEKKHGSKAWELFKRGWPEQANPNVFHNLARKHHESNTCEWFLHIPQWESWLRNGESDRFLWIYGNPGAGKTILASFLIEHCQLYCQTTSGQSCCVYYYCSFRNYHDDHDDSILLLKWLLCQLSCRTSRVEKYFYEKCSFGQEQLTDMLAKFLTDMEIVYLVIDAMDESRPLDKLLLLLEALVTDPRLCKLRLLVTSRRYHDITSALTGLSSPISMSNEEANKEMHTFIIAQLDKKFTGWHAAHKSSILDALVEKAKGVFRVALCHVEILLSKRTTLELYESLDRLPETLQDSYEMILLEIEKEEWPLARVILLWICANEKLPGHKPIPVNTICSMMILHSSDTTDKHLEYSVDDIKRICGCLITISYFENSIAGGSDTDNDRLATTRGFDAATCSDYTIVEYLFSDVIRQGKAAFFALSDEDTIVTFLGTILEIAVRTNLKLVVPEYWTGLGDYCVRAAWLAPFIWESRIVRIDRLWTDSTKLWLATESYFERMAQLFDDYLPDASFPKARGDFLCRWETLEDRSSQTLEEKLTIVITCLLLNSWVALARRLVIEHHPRILSGTPSYFSESSYCLGSQVPIKDKYLGSAIEALAVSSIGMDEEPQQSAIELINEYELDKTRTVLIYISLHFGPTGFCNCEESDFDVNRCPLTELLPNYDSHDEAITYRLTPLQLAVHCWDYAATKALLETGVDPDGLGCAFGEPVPIHIYEVDDGLSLASPLYIIRNADYAPEDIDGLINIMEKRRASRDKIEAVLISYGATYFTLS
ncbi:hypothetical protein BP6252_05977 [Coleophoma cylindrospora]|uniref:Nephrocystin 3-like N-terminal domain-containing protein n=1 Tax=Coleophoma cylindrospora TaxID=1849047 RepID=A0A3D8RLB0_9HELO|nr:hypothetical protein BP6252_05977 [Coleophoma cylindrospora]